MKHILLSVVLIPAAVAIVYNFSSRFFSGETSPPPSPSISDSVSAEAENSPYVIAGIVRSNDTLDSIFNRYNLLKGELSEIYEKSREKFNLSKISVGSMYSFELDRSKNTIRRMQFGIDDGSFLDVVRKPEGFVAEKVSLPVQSRTGALYIDIKDNLVSSMPGKHREYHRLALELSDIYAWDIDFSNDIRKGDSVKIIVEELWVGEAFRGFGKILAAEFINNGKSHYAFRFEQKGYSDYYDEKGNSLRKALLRSPLRFKYISSRFSRRRFHPKLRIYRPHLGVDYAARTGTPVSAAGSGKIVFAGYKGQMGRMVRIKHPGGYETYYGHLSRIPKKIFRGAVVSQGDLIGYVGATGLATGPHLDYRIKFNGRFVNPLTISLPRGESIQDNLMARFTKAVHYYDYQLSSMTGPVMASKDKTKSAG